MNKPNVRFVFHVGVPPNVEAWVQEAGRGGRDGVKVTVVHISPYTRSIHIVSCKLPNTPILLER